MTESMRLTPAPRRTFKMKQPTKDTLRAQIRELQEENGGLRARVAELEQQQAGGPFRHLLSKLGFRLRLVPPPSLPAPPPVLINVHNEAKEKEAPEDGRE